VAFQKGGEAIDGLVSAVASFQDQAHEVASRQARLGAMKPASDLRLPNGQTMLVYAVRKAPPPVRLAAEDRVGSPALWELDVLGAKLFAGGEFFAGDATERAPGTQGPVDVDAEERVSIHGGCW